MRQSAGDCFNVLLSQYDHRVHRCRCIECRCDECRGAVQEYQQFEKKLIKMPSCTNSNPVITVTKSKCTCKADV